jgi:hypothetical protein
MELYNITEDIGETNNLFATKTDMAKELAGALSDYLEGVKAQMPLDKKTGKKVEFPIAIFKNEQN